MKVAPIRCLIVDDEPLAQDVVAHYIARLGYLTLVGKVENAVDAFDFVQNEPVDLIFCDIQMPEVSGIEFIKALKTPPLVIFTTAFSEYALEGFNVDAVDYLLKPISFERFLKSVQKVKGLLSDTSRPELAEKHSDYLFVKEDYKLLKISHKDIFYVEGMRDYVKIFTRQKMVITHITLKRLEELLPQSDFLRTHKSFIVRFETVKAVDGNTIEIGDNLKVPIGAQYRESVMQVFSNIK